MRIVAEGDGAVALRELCAVGPMDQRNMGIARRRPAARQKQLRLPERVGQMIIATDRMGDRHVVIIDHDGKHVGRRAIGPEQHHVVEFGVADRDAALHQILDHRFARLRRLEADDRPRAGRRFLRVAVAPAAIIFRRAALGPRPLAHLGQLLGRAVAMIGLALGQQVARNFSVARRARKLKHRLAVPIEAEPAQPLDDRAHRVLG